MKCFEWYKDESWVFPALKGCLIQLQALWLQRAIDNTILFLEISLQNNQYYLLRDTVTIVYLHEAKVLKATKFQVHLNDNFEKLLGAACGD